jgi:NAD(P)-dependent dehydrogenase (short-subunit alcohol dehydrogenase family)
MSTIEPSGAAGTSAAPEAVGARLTASPNPRYERRWMALGVLVIAQIIQYLLPLMSDGASIILNGTTSATKGIPGAGVYSASKAAVRSLARTWAAELKDRGIRVNVISPGSIDTALFSTVTPEFREQVTSAIPLGRLGTSEEIAAAALFLASPDASFITGANLVVDGGFSHI